MGRWKAKRRQAAYSRLVAKVSEHDVIWAAEEIVGTAWMAGLAEAERQAASAQRICTRMRDSAYEVHNAAETEQDPDRLSASARDLDASRQALGRVDERHDRLRRFAERERAAWEQAEWTRTLEVLSDKDLLNAAAREIDPGKAPGKAKAAQEIEPGEATEDRPSLDPGIRDISVD